MNSSRFISRSMAVAASTAALALGFSGLASAATTISPAGTTVTASNVNAGVTYPMTFTTTGGIQLRCTGVTGTGTIPASPGNVNSGTGGVNVNIASVGLSGCTLQGRPATVSTSGDWVLNGNNDSGAPKGTITIPNGGAVITSGACSITVNATTTPPLPYDNATNKATASGAGPINFTSNGGTTFCPAAGPGTATMDGALFFPGVTIT